MPKAYFLPDRVEVEVKEGQTLMKAAKAAGIPQVCVCGGLGRCSTCRVIVIEGLENCSPPSKDELDIIKMLNLPPNVRLTCQTTITGPVRVRKLVENLEDVDFFSIFIEGVEVLTGLGEEKDIFILFADIQAFTVFAEDLLPYDVLYSLNLYLSQMGAIVKQHGGRIDNYMGDGFMALFESHNPADGARRAVRASLEMLEEVQRLAPYLQELYGRSFDIRIGLHFGRVVAGKLGYPGAKRGTVIGNAVNLASRIEAANKQVGTRFLISKEIYELIREEIVVGKEIAMELPGKTGECPLFEVVELKNREEGRGKREN